MSIYIDKNKDYERNLANMFAEAREYIKGDKLDYHDLVKAMLAEPDPLELPADVKYEMENWAAVHPEN